MNRANLRILRDHLATLDPARFDMGWWFTVPDIDTFETLADVPPEHQCGTVACLAGWCQILGAETDFEKAWDTFAFARDWLGLAEKAADRLFLGDFAWPEKHLEDITLADAITELDRMLEAPDA